MTASAGHRRRGSAQIVRDWVLRFNARGPDGLLDGKAPGRQSLLNDAQRRALVEMVECGPIPSIHGVVRWRLIDLAGWHMTGKLDVPNNISIIVLPAKCPELNPVENIWAVHARQLAIQSGVHFPRQYRRPLLRGVE